MAGTSSAEELHSLESWADPASCEGSGLIYMTAPAAPSEGEHTTTSCTPFFAAGSVEDEIERSRSHWSELSGLSPSSNDEEVAADNRALFLSLQDQPQWGDFFQTFNHDTGVELRAGSLEVEEKFAEGGQAELFHARVTWKEPKLNEEDLQDGDEHVVKVFKKGTRLRHLQSQWPLGYLCWSAELEERDGLGEDLGGRYVCHVRCGTVLEDGRFAFVMVKETEDYRKVIDRRMKSKTTQDCGPFSKFDTLDIMWRIAKGMEWLHSQNIVHRDLKASNVLTNQRGPNGNINVADFECSVGVVGTGFFRAPEILQALKDRNLSQTPKVFSEAADVYSYGLACYEVLTRKLPFEGHPANDYDLVLNGKRPEVPEYVDGWARELLNRCWQSNPTDRPSFTEVVNLFDAKFEEEEED